jgi:anti-sigma B factor antagonist
MTSGERPRRTMAACLTHGKARTRHALPGESRLAPETGVLTRWNSQGTIPVSRREKGGELVMDDYGLTIEVRQEPGHMLVTVAGEVDIATVPQMQERLAAPAGSGQPLIVNLDRITFIDAAGLGALAGAASRAAERDASLHVVCTRHQVRRLFAITGLDRQIPLARTVTEACQNLLAAAWEIRVKAGMDAVNSRSLGP